MNVSRRLLPCLTLTAVLIFGTGLPLDAYSGPSGFKVQKQEYKSKSDVVYKRYRYDRNDYGYGYGRNYYGHKDSYKRYKEKKYRHHYSDRDKRYRHKDFIDVLPKGSHVVIINGHTYHRWQDKYYLSGYYKGDKVFIAIDL